MLHLSPLDNIGKYFSSIARKAALLYTKYDTCILQCTESRDLCSQQEFRVKQENNEVHNYAQ